MTDVIKQAKKTIGIGVVGMAGMGIMGNMQAIPGMPAQASGLTSITGTAMNLSAIGNLAKIGTSMFDEQKPAKKPSILTKF